jgi:hypothetical protein
MLITLVKAHLHERCEKMHQERGCACESKRPSPRGVMETRALRDTI